MATTTIPWNDGSGDVITLTYPSASGNQTVVVTSDANTGAARSKTVTFSTGSITRQLTVNQEAGAPQEHTLEVYPSSYDSENSTYYSISYINRAYTSAESTTYATINYVRGAGAETFFFFKFNLSSIPTNATIKSIALKATLRSSNVAVLRLPTRHVDVCRGTTAVGQATEFALSNATYDIDCGTGWTGANIQDFALRIHVVRGTQNVDTNYSAYFSGATLTITYEA